MVDLYRQFLVQPTADRYRAALKAFIAAPADAVPSLLALEQAFCDGCFETVRTLGQDWQRFFALSPRFHRLVALASLELGDQQDAEIERFAAEACLEGVLSSGDGTQAHPYLLSQSADAHEVLKKLGLKAVRQASVESQGALCDVFEVRDRAKATQEVWFVVAGAQVFAGEPRKTARASAKKSVSASATRQSRKIKV
jgi:hypothetical protein